MDQQFYNRVDKYSIIDTPTKLECCMSYDRSIPSEELIKEEIFQELHQSIEDALYKSLISNSTKQYTTKSPITSIMDVKLFSHKPMCSYETFVKLRDTVGNTTHELLEYTDVTIVHKNRIPSDVIIEHFGIDLYMSEVKYTTITESPHTPNLIIYGKIEYSIRFIGTPNYYHIVKDGSEEYLHYKLEKRSKTIKRILNNGL